MVKKIILFLFLGILLIGSLSAADLPTGGVSYCCEKTVDGSWCQNAVVDKCDVKFKKVPTSCQATSYCKLGCCYDTQEGTCMENTPQRVCQSSGGIWGDNAQCDIPQCELGCCLIGEQGAFVTQTRCKKLSGLYGLEINFRTDIGSEIDCIASITSEVKGACVFEKEFEKTCKFTTKKDCMNMKSTTGNTTVFHEGYLCSAEELGTVCGPSEKTTCVEGRDEVFFVDSCGNLANIYDYSRIKDKTYWEKVVPFSDSCNPSKSNADSSTCGNCDYFLGSTCKEFKRSEDTKPAIGNYICKDLSCIYEGKTYQHGETWCAKSKGTSQIVIGKEKLPDNAKENIPGSKYFRLVCYNGEVSVEPCAEYRQEVCIQSEVNGFKTAGCRVNKWQDCSAQKEKADCENEDRRDCVWVGEKCVPKYAPGFDFWNPEGDGSSSCATANAECTVTYEKKLGGEKTCVSGCECISSSWESNMNKVCSAIGDCGSKVNYIGILGFKNKKPTEVIANKTK